MELVPRTRGCEDGNCPKISDVPGDGDMVAVQGTTALGLEGIPGHESVVLLPRRLVLEYAEFWSTQSG